MASLLAGKVGQPAAAIIDFVLRQAWATGRDLADAFVQLGRTAMFLRAERAGELDEVEDQLFRFGRILDGSPELSVILDDPITHRRGPRVAGRAVARRPGPSAHRGPAGPARPRPGRRSFSHGVDTVGRQAAERKDKIVATVESATSLTIEQTSRLTAALTRIYGRPVSVHVLLQPVLAGGIKVVGSATK